MQDQQESWRCVVVRAAAAAVLGNGHERGLPNRPAISGTRCSVPRDTVHFFRFGGKYSQLFMIQCGLDFIRFYT
jgi:hypothetical protein